MLVHTLIWCMLLFVSSLSHFWHSFFHIHLLYQTYFGLCQATCVQSHQRQPRSTVAIATCEVQLSADDYHTVLMGFPIIMTDICGSMGRHHSETAWGVFASKCMQLINLHLAMSSVKVLKWTDIQCQKYEKYLQVWRTRYLALFMMFTCSLFQIYYIYLLLSYWVDFKALGELWNPRSKVGIGKFDGSGGHSKLYKTEPIFTNLGHVLILNIVYWTIWENHLADFYSWSQIWM